MNNCCSSLILTDNLSEVVGIYIAVIGQRELLVVREALRCVLFAGLGGNIVRRTDSTLRVAFSTTYFCNVLTLQ